MISLWTAILSHLPTIRVDQTETFSVPRVNVAN
jgi:hypothetical protein